MLEATASSIFNSSLLGYVVLLFNKLDLFPHFSAGISLAGLIQLCHLEERRLRVIINFAQTMGVLQEEAGIYRLTTLGGELAKNRGFFTWAIGGYSPLLENMDLFLNAPASTSRGYVRGDYVAIGSDECHQELMRPTLERVMSRIQASCIADLGCGNAGRLVELLIRHPEITGIGIDIDPAAIALAMKNREAQGLQARLRLVQEDVFASLTDSGPQLARVEVVMSFMMLHDLFNQPKLSNSLFQKMKAAFPNARYFLLADTCLDEKAYDYATVPVFTRGYELIHALRGIKTFPLHYYHEQFRQGGLNLIAQHYLGVPNTYLFVLEV